MKQKLIFSLLLLFLFAYKAEAVTYLDGTSPLLSSSPAGTFDLGTFKDDHIASTVAEGNGTALDGTRVYFFDATGSTDNPATADPFNLLVWNYTSPKDSLRLYTHQDHLSSDGLADTDFEAQDVMEYSVWGCKGGLGSCTTEAEWSILSDVIGYSDISAGKPIYTFSGTEPTTVYRGGSGEFGLLNAYTRDYTFSEAYDYYGLRASTISMLQNDADPELDAAVAFNRVDFPEKTVAPEPASMILFGVGGTAMAFMRRRKA